MSYVLLGNLLKPNMRSYSVRIVYKDGKTIFLNLSEHKAPWALARNLTNDNYVVIFDYMK